MELRDDDLVLALDQGGSASRALVFDRRGRASAQASVPIATRAPGPGRVEHDADELVRSLEKAVREVARQLGARAASIRAAGLATQRSSVAFWDRTSGAALAPVLSWQDRRAADRLAPLAARADEVRARTGLRLSPHYGATKIAWALEEIPDVRRAREEGRLACGPLASFLAHRLCSERPLVADAANASRTLLYDVRAGDWSEELCALFGVPRSVLPRCAGTRSAFGTLDVGDRRVPLLVLTGDQSAASYSAGEPPPDRATVTFGTGAFVLRALAPGAFESAPLDAPRLLTTLVDKTSERTTFALEGTVNGAGSALAWAASELGVDVANADLPRWLERERDPPLFLNGVGGLAAPFWVSDFASRFEGEGTREARVVAVLESAVFLVRAVLDEMARALPAARVLRAGGGLARLDGLCQRLASLARVPVERSEQTETTALGLAVLLGATPPAAAPKVFEPAADPALAARYDRWRALMPR